MSSPSELAFKPLGAHSSGLDVSSAVTLSVPSGATQLLIQVFTQNLRITLDGTTPTSTTGFQIKAGDPPIIIPVSWPITVKVIQEAATASLQYQFGGFA